MQPRIYAAVRVLRGKPTVYGMDLYGTIEQTCFDALDERVAAVSCHINGGWEDAPEPGRPFVNSEVAFPACRDGEAGS